MEKYRPYTPSHRSFFQISLSENRKERRTRNDRERATEKRFFLEMCHEVDWARAIDQGRSFLKISRGNLGKSHGQRDDKERATLSMIPIAPSS